MCSLYNPTVEDYAGHGQIYHVKPDIKDTIESNASACYLDSLLSIGKYCQLDTLIHDKRDEFNFHIENVLLMSNNMPSSPTYAIFISQIHVQCVPGFAPEMNLLL